MKKIIYIALLLTWVCPLRAAEDASAALQKGLFEEEANQNLEAAIKAYQSVIEISDQQRKLAATAVFRLGECYRKLARTNEAAAQYQRILSQYSEQTTLANLSRQNLAGLGIIQKKPEVTEVGEGGKYRNLPAAQRQEIKKLFQDEIAIAEKALAEAVQRRKAGVISSEEVAKHQKELSDLKRELLMVDGLNTPEAREHTKELLRVNVELAQRDLDVMRKQFEAGVVSSAEVAEAERELLKRKRELLLAESTAANSSASEPAKPVLDEEDRQLAHYQNLFKDSPDLVNGQPNQEIPLHKAARAGQLKVAEFLLSKGAEINGRGPRDITPLHLAVENGRKTMVELLLARGADVNARYWQDVTPLHVAAGNGLKAIAETLLRHKANINAVTSRNPPLSGDYYLLAQATPLHVAIHKGYIAMVELLLQNGANVEAIEKDGNPALITAVQSSRPELISTLLKYQAKVDATNNAGNTALHVAVSLGQQATAEMLLKNKANVNAKDNRGDTPLHKAVVYTKAGEPMVELLLAHGADINAVTDLQQSQRESALHLVVRKNDEALAKILLTHKPNLEITNKYGFTPLHEAMQERPRWRMAQLLLEAGADVNAVVQNTGETPLFLAINNGYKEHVELLLGHKANPNVINKYGRYPLLLVINRVGAGPNTQSEIRQLLLQAGANEALARQYAIDVTRRPNTIPNSPYSSRVFSRKNTNTWNQYTLLELIAQVYLPWGPHVSYKPAETPLAFPNFTGINITRWDLKTGRAGLLDPVNVHNMLVEPDGAKRDFFLNWGDSVEIPEAVHTLGQRWVSLPSSQYVALYNHLKRKVTVVVEGEPHELMLTLFPSNVLLSQKLTNWIPGDSNISSFRLKTVLQASELLRTSSDLARIRVKRVDPITGEKREGVFDVRPPAPKPDPLGTGVTITFSDGAANKEDQDDLWLRDGDVIEVPKKE